MTVELDAAEEGYFVSAERIEPWVFRGNWYPADSALTVYADAQRIVTVTVAGESTFDWPAIERTAADEGVDGVVRCVCIALLAAKREGSIP